jgi:flagellar basal-body rod modification protein FlgD
MTDISAVSAASTPATSRPSVANDLGADTFLQLLVAQLKYQDPTNPASSTEFLAQTAQFTMVEKLTQLAEQSEASAVVNRNLGAASMVGRTVTYLRPDGTTGEGVVTRAVLGSAGPVLTVGTDEVPFGLVSAVVAPAAAPAAPTAPAAATPAPAKETAADPAPTDQPQTDPT